MNANRMRFVAGLVGLGVWAALVFAKLAPPEPLIDLLKMGLGGLVVLMLKDGSPSASPASTTGASQ